MSPPLAMVYGGTECRDSTSAPGLVSSAALDANSRRTWWK
jgi:hypothetical protein